MTFMARRMTSRIVSSVSLKMHKTYAALITENFKHLKSSQVALHALHGIARQGRCNVTEMEKHLTIGNGSLYEPMRVGCGELMTQQDGSCL